MTILDIQSLDELPDAAAKILESLGERRVVAFEGPMGAGKTTLIREICEQLGVVDTVTSPTFALINRYTTRGERTVYHFDFYRIENVSEAFDMGYEEYLFSGELCLIEWPEKIAGLLPENTVRVRILTDPEDELCRRIEVN